MAKQDIDNFSSPARLAQVAELHRKALAWEPQGWIPLGIHVANPEHTAALDYAQWLEPAPFFAAQYKILRDTLAVGSDLLPAVAINHLGDAVITSMFGAEQFMPDFAGATLQDIGPTPLPLFSSIEAAADADMPALEAGIVPDVERILTTEQISLERHNVHSGAGR